MQSQTIKFEKYHKMYSHIIIHNFVKDANIYY